MFDRTKKQLSTTLEICINISKVKCVFDARNVLWLVFYRNTRLNQIKDIHRKVTSPMQQRFLNFFSKADVIIFKAKQNFSVVMRCCDISFPGMLPTLALFQLCFRQCFVLKTINNKLFLEGETRKTLD